MAATILVAAIGLSACTGPADPASDRPVPASESAPQTSRTDVARPPSSGVLVSPSAEVSPAAVVDATRAALPLFGYMPAFDQRQALIRAEAILADRCMRGFGFPASPIPPVSTSGAIADSMAARYFIADLAQARTVGYHRNLLPEFVAADAAGARGAERGRAFTASLGAQAEAYALVFSGVTSTGEPADGRQISGRTVPDGGCSEQARRTLEEAAGRPYPSGGLGGVADSLENGTWSQAAQSAVVQAVFRKWSDCMAAQGFRYANPIDANNDRAWASERPSPREIRTAVADVQCKQSTRLVGTWREEEVRIQDGAVEANSLALAEDRATWQAWITAAARVLDGSGLPQ